jgi:hypothetical protein
MIREYIKKHFLKKLEKGRGLVIYDPTLFYKDIVLELQDTDIKVFDASENVVTAREEALDYWVYEMPQNNNTKIVVYVPFKVKIDHDELTFDPFIIFSAAGKVFPDEAADEYRQMCIAALPDKEKELEAFFREDKQPSFELIDALSGGNSYPVLKSGLNAVSNLEILLALLVPTETQRVFLENEKNWIKEFKVFAKSVLGCNLQKQKFDSISTELWNILLFSEFAHDLPLSLPDKLIAVPQAKTDAKQLIYEVCSHIRNRKDHEEKYIHEAQRVSDELKLAAIFSDETNLGLINTFAFEDSAYFKVFRDYLLQENLDDAALMIVQSKKSIWSAYDSDRRLTWLIAGKALSLKKMVLNFSADIKKHKQLKDIIHWYSNELYELDTLYRELDENIAEVHSLSALLKEVHKHASETYFKFIEIIQAEFQKLLKTEGLNSVGILHNIELFDKKVEPLVKGGKKTVYILVDGMRYELAKQLLKGLERASYDTELYPSRAFIPAVTKFAMAALMPKASQNLSLKVKENKLVPHLSGIESSTRESRIKYCSAIYGDKISWAWEKDILNKNFNKSDLLVVTTVEIDKAGETNPDNAQILIKQALSKIVKVAEILKSEGYEEFVLASDHGFVLLNEYKAGNKGEKPMGEWYLQKSRGVAGKGAGNSDHYEFNASELGINSEADNFFFLKNYATYDKGKQFFHEGISLQELITPCLSFRPRKLKRKEEYQVNLTYKGKTSGAVTTLMPSIEISTFGDSAYASLDLQVEVISSDKTVGHLAPSEFLNSTTGCLELEMGKAYKISIIMNEDFEGTFKVYAKSPSSGLILSEITLTTNYF